MIAAIVLTLKSNLTSKKQFIFKQMISYIKYFLKQIKEFNKETEEYKIKREKKLKEGKIKEPTFSENIKKVVYNFFQ